MRLLKPVSGERAVRPGSRLGMGTGRVIAASLVLCAVLVAGASSASTASTSALVNTSTSASCDGLIVGGSMLSGIDFLNSSLGLGVWSQVSRCGARLVITSDGGMTWRLEGGPFPEPASDFSLISQPEIVFLTRSDGWIDSSGVLITTRDGGTHWSVVHLGTWVQTISRFGSSLWAFVAPCKPMSRCRYWLKTTTVASTSWRNVGPLPSSLGNFMPLVVTRLTLSNSVAGIGQMVTSPVVLTTDSGSRWASVKACAPEGYVPISFARADPAVAWVLCLGGAAAGSSLKSLLRTTDGGKTWHLVAVDRSLSSGPRPVPTDDGGVLAVSFERLWMATVNSLYASADSGKQWVSVSNVNPNGNGGFSMFSFVSATRGWLLVPGSGLWRTTNGRTWQSVGPS